MSRDTHAYLGPIEDDWDEDDEEDETEDFMDYYEEGGEG